MANTFTMDELETALADLEKQKAAFLTIPEGTKYETVRTMMVVQLRTTYGAASDTIALLERATGRTLPR